MVVFCLAEKLSFHKHWGLGSFCQDCELPTKLPDWPFFFYEDSQSPANSHHLTFFCRINTHLMYSGSKGKYHAEYPSSTSPHPLETSTFIHPQSSLTTGTTAETPICPFSTEQHTLARPGPLRRKNIHL